MSRRTRRRILVLLLCLLGAPRSAQAQASGLPAVERAYRDIDLELTRRLADEALGKGGHNVAETARLELLRGLASAALGQQELAYRAFVRLLAIDPERKLERELSPKMRAPYLEARGYWGSFDERLGARVEVEERAFAVTVSDPGDLVARVRLELHGPRGTERHEQAKHAGGARVPRPASALAPSAYTVTLLDDRGNALHQGRGALAVRPAASKPVLGPPSQAAGQRSGASRTPLLLASVGFAVLGAGATTIALLAHREREQKADEWNGSTCERPGATRGAQCAAIRAEIRERERWAIGMYAASGALIAGSVITLLLAPSAAPRSQHAQAATRCGPGFLSLHCAGAF